MTKTAICTHYINAHARAARDGRDAFVQMLAGEQSPEAVAGRLRQLVAEADNPALLLLLMMDFTEAHAIKAYSKADQRSLWPDELTTRAINLPALPTRALKDLWLVWERRVRDRHGAHPWPKLADLDGS